MFIHETNVSTQQNQASKSMRIPKENENGKRSRRHQPKKTPRKKAFNHRIGLSFPKSIRVLTKNRFGKIFAKGIRSSHGMLFFRYCKEESIAKLGITVSKKYGKSHERNRFKRLVRETFREIYDEIPYGISVNVSPSPACTNPEKSDIAKDFRSFLSSL